MELVTWLSRLSEVLVSSSYYRHGLELAEPTTNQPCHTKLSVSSTKPLMILRYASAPNPCIRNSGIVLEVKGTAPHDNVAVTNWWTHTVDILAPPSHLCQSFQNRLPEHIEQCGGLSSWLCHSTAKRWQCEHFPLHVRKRRRNRPQRSKFAWYRLSL